MVPIERSVTPALLTVVSPAHENCLKTLRQFSSLTGNLLHVLRLRDFGPKRITHPDVHRFAGDEITAGQTERP